MGRRSASCARALHSRGALLPSPAGWLGAWLVLGPFHAALPDEATLRPEAGASHGVPFLSAAEAARRGSKWASLAEALALDDRLERRGRHRSPRALLRGSASPEVVGYAAGELHLERDAHLPPARSAPTTGSASWSTCRRVRCARGVATPARRRRHRPSRPHEGRPHDPPRPPPARRGLVLPRPDPRRGDARAARGRAPRAPRHDAGRRSRPRRQACPGCRWTAASRRRRVPPAPHRPLSRVERPEPGVPLRVGARLAARGDRSLFDVDAGEVLAQRRRGHRDLASARRGRRS